VAVSTVAQLLVEREQLHHGLKGITAAAR